MVTPTFDISPSRHLGAAPAGRGECLRYRLDVVAASAVDVAHSAGDGSTTAAWRAGR